MAITVKHAFTNPIADEPGFTGTKPSDWNADHVVTGSGSPGGANTDIQFNDGAGGFGGDASFTYAGNGAVTIGASGHSGTAALTNTNGSAVTIGTTTGTGAWNLNLPTTAGTNTYVLQTDGSGNTSWVPQSGGGGSPGTPVHSVQFNNPLGTFAGTGDFIWTTGAGNGLQIGGAVAGSPATTPGTSERAAIGNYALIDRGTFAAGDPTNVVSPASVPAPKISLFNNFVDADFSTFTHNEHCCGIQIFPSVKNTGNGSLVDFYGVDCEPVIISTSTGALASINAAFLQPYNYGSGNILGLTGVTCSANNVASGGAILFNLSGGVFSCNNQSGTVSGNCQGGNFFGEIDGGQCTNVVGGVFGQGNYGGTVTGSAIGAWIQNGGGSGSPNAYGLLIDDQVGQGSTTSYNLYSAGLGGNLFQGVTMVSNVAGAYIDPGGIAAYPVYNPTGGGSPFKIATTFATNFAYSGDLSAGLYNDGTSSLVMWDGLNHTGTNKAYYVGIDYETQIGGTGPYSTIAIFSCAPNYQGSGNVDNYYGVQCIANFFGSGACTHSFGGQFITNIGGGTGGTEQLGGDFEVFSGAGSYTDTIAGRFQSHGYGAFNTTNLYGVLVLANNAGGGTVTNNYGVYISDQHSVGGTRAENIRSAGAASFNYFEGFTNTGGSLVSGLPSPTAYLKGMRYYVTDALGPVFGSPVAGSGAVTIPVFCDGTNWIVG